MGERSHPSLDFLDRNMSMLSPTTLRTYTTHLLQ
jgi:hypothetical protein